MGWGRRRHEDPTRTPRGTSQQHRGGWGQPPLAPRADAARLWDAGRPAAYPFPPRTSRAPAAGGGQRARGAAGKPRLHNGPRAPAGRPLAAPTRLSQCRPTPGREKATATEAEGEKQSQHHPTPPPLPPTTPHGVATRGRRHQGPTAASTWQERPPPCRRRAAATGATVSGAAATRWRRRRWGRGSPAADVAAAAATAIGAATVAVSAATAGGSAHSGGRGGAVPAAAPWAWPPPRRRRHGCRLGVSGHGRRRLRRRR